MSQEDVGIGEPSPTGTSGQERRWAILRWLSVKMHDAPPSEILEAAERFEKFVAAEVAGQKLSKEALSKIERASRELLWIVSDQRSSLEDREDRINGGKNCDGGSRFGLRGIDRRKSLDKRLPGPGKANHGTVRLKFWALSNRLLVAGNHRISARFMGSRESHFQPNCR